MLHSLHRKQLLNTSLTKAWEFFSDPRNLAKITPADLALDVNCELKTETYLGQIITYTVKPFLGIKTSWVTEITALRKEEFFIDEQRFGPYSFWHHKHFFYQEADGALVEDLIHYKMPLGILLEPVHQFFVRPKLDKIFDFRAGELKKVFPE